VKEIPIEAVLTRYLPAMEFKRSGSRLVAKCPFHGDKTPSFTIFPDGGFKCFGCGAGGDSVTLVARALGIRPVEAARQIAADFGLPVGGRPGPEARRRVREAKEQREAKQMLDALCNHAYQRLCLVARSLEKSLTSYEAYENLAFWVHRQEQLEIYLDILSDGDEKKKVHVLNESLVKKLCS